MRERRRLGYVQANYRFHIQPLASAEPRYQVTVGMIEERDHELVPAYRTAFAHRLSLSPSHGSIVEAQTEMNRLVAWLDDRAICFSQTAPTDS